jgi:Zn finger protein HypA/HybF involved in hydrogenase expression
MAKEEVEKSELEGEPVCEKCGSILIWEPFDSAQGDSLDKTKKSEEGELVCPTCQGEIDFLGDDEDEL